MALPNKPVPTCPFWPLTANSWVEYDSYTFPKSSYDPASMRISIDTPNVLVDRFRRTHVPAPHLQYPAVAILDTRLGVVPAQDWSNVDRVLYQGLRAQTGAAAFIGESGDLTNEMWPPECEITVNPLAGETITDTSVGNSYDPASGMDVPFKVSWRYKTIGPGPGPNNTWWLSQYPDQMMTALEERPGTGGAQGHYAYNYLYARNVGVINFFWGPLNADNTISNGNQWVITGHGQG